MKCEQWENAEPVEGTGYCSFCKSCCAVYQVRGGEGYLAYDLLRSECCDVFVVESPEDTTPLIDVDELLHNVR